MNRKADCQACCCSSACPPGFPMDCRNVRVPVTADRCQELPQGYATNYQQNRNVGGQLFRSLSSETTEALAALREKTCKALRMELKAMTEACQPWPGAPTQREGAGVQRQADLIDYIPESEFLRKMKQQCEYLRSNQENIFSALDALGLSDYPVEYAKSGADFISSHQVSVRKSPSENLGQTEHNQYSQRPMTAATANDKVVEYVHRGRMQTDGFEGGKFEGGRTTRTSRTPRTRNVTRKSEHISRPKKKTFNNRGRRKRTTSEKSQSRERFEPTLKRPHEDSCERCWRYASPARSPVNKPDQKYDPNFRKAHSQPDFERGDGSRPISTETVSFRPVQTTSGERFRSPGQRPATQQADQYSQRDQVGSPAGRPDSRQQGQVGQPRQRPGSPRHRDDFPAKGQIGSPGQRPATGQMDGYSPKGQVGSPGRRPAPRQMEECVEMGQVGPPGQRAVPRQMEGYAQMGQVGPPGHRAVPRQMDGYAQMGQVGSPGQRPAPRQMEECVEMGQVGSPGQRPATRQMDGYSPKGQVGSPGRRPAPRQMEECVQMGQVGSPGQRPAPRQMEECVEMGQVGSPGQRPATRQMDGYSPKGQVGSTGRRPAPRQMEECVQMGQVGSPGQRPAPRQMEECVEMGQVGSPGQRPAPRQMDGYAQMGQVGSPGQRPAPRQMEECVEMGQVGPSLQRPATRQMDGYPPKGQVGSPGRRPATRQMEECVPMGPVVPCYQGPVPRQMEECVPMDQVGPPQQQQFVQKAARPTTAYSDVQPTGNRGAGFSMPPQGSGVRQKNEIPRRGPTPNQYNAEKARVAATKPKAQDLINNLQPMMPDKNVSGPQGVGYAEVRNAMGQGNATVCQDNGTSRQAQQRRGAVMSTPKQYYAEKARVAATKPKTQEFNDRPPAMGQGNMPVCQEEPVTSFVCPGLFAARDFDFTPCSCCAYTRTIQPGVCPPPCDFSPGLSPVAPLPGGRVPGVLPGSPVGGFSDGRAAGAAPPGGRSPAARSPAGRSPAKRSPGRSLSGRSPGHRSPIGGLPPDETLDGVFLVPEYGSSVQDRSFIKAQNKPGTPKGLPKTQANKAKRGAPQSDGGGEKAHIKEDQSTGESRKKGKMRTPSPKQGGKSKRETPKPKTSRTSRTPPSGKKSPSKSSKSSKTPKSRRIWALEPVPSKTDSSFSKSASPPSKEVWEWPKKRIAKSPLGQISQKSQEPPNEKKCDYDYDLGHIPLHVLCPDLGEFTLNQAHASSRTTPDACNRGHPTKECCCAARVGKGCCGGQEGPPGCILCCHCDLQPNSHNQNNEINPTSAWSAAVPASPRRAVAPASPRSAAPPATARPAPENVRDLCPPTDLGPAYPDYYDDDCYVECPYTECEQNVRAAPNSRQVPPQPEEVNKRALRERQNFFQPPYNCDVNPKTYFMFYMTKPKQGKGDDVEVLVEELSQSCPGAKDTRTRDIAEKMKKIMECPSDSLALRFQKGVTESCKTPRSSRTLYF